MSKHLASLIVAGLALVASVPAPAQDKFDRPLRILVGFAAGGTADLMARLVADKMKIRSANPCSSRIGRERRAASLRTR
jgi:tripartite-type tricarboxylate transporter receptor subunit TctC